jgi:hypothetical protein
MKSGWSVLMRLSDQTHIWMLRASNLRRHCLLKEMNRCAFSCVCVGGGAKHRSIAAVNRGSFQNYAYNQFLRGFLELIGNISWLVF